MHIGFTTVSSRGQIVIPKEFRNIFRQGDKLVLMSEGEKMIVKKAQELMTKEDEIFLRNIELSRKDYEDGKFTHMSRDEFLEELKKWTSN